RISRTGCPLRRRGLDPLNRSHPDPANRWAPRHSRQRQGTGWTTTIYCGIEIWFEDSGGTWTLVQGLQGTSTFKTEITIPIDATRGFGTFEADQGTYDPEWRICLGPAQIAWARFTVTEQGRWWR